MDKASLWGQLRTSVFVVSSLMPDWFAKHSTMARIQVVFLLVVPILVRCFFEFPIAQHIPFCRSHVDRSVQYWQVAEVTKGYGQGVNKGQISNYLFRAIIPNAKLIRAALKKGENPDLLPFTECPVRWICITSTVRDGRYLVYQWWSWSEFYYIFAFLHNTNFPWVFD